MFRRAMLLAVLVLLLVASVAGGQTPDAEPAGFSLELAHSASVPREFHLFPSAGAPAAADLALLAGLELVPGRDGSASFGLIGPDQPQLTTVLVFDPVAARRAELRLFRLPRLTWEEMTPWERTGWIVANASAVAGMAVLLDELF